MRPDVSRSQVFSLIDLPLLVMLTLLPLLRRVFTLVLLTFGNDVFLLEHGNGWLHTFIQVLLIHFHPVCIPSLFPHLDTCQDLLLVGFQCGQVFWGEYIGWTVKTRQFSKLADQFWWFST